MSSKGPSNRFGNKGKATSRVSFQWAKAFNKKTLTKHFQKHGSDFPSMTKEEYEARAIKFANTINKSDCVSFVDKKGSTHKLNRITGEYCITSKDGYVITYFKPDKPNEYLLTQLKKAGK